jgi:uncharacterized membrane protein
MTIFDRGTVLRSSKCSICNKNFSVHDLVSVDTIPNSVKNEITKDYLDWSGFKGYVCKTDLNMYRAKYIRSVLEIEKQELTEIEFDVLKSLHEHEIISKNVELQFEGEWTFGQKLADKIATFGGSWTFLIYFSTFLVSWIAINTLQFLIEPFDPHPFILLNLILSCLAAVQAPVIMMSQNRREAKDRLRSQQAYKVNLKAELELRHLNEKIDYLLNHQLERLNSIQAIQFSLLSEIMEEEVQDK